MSDSMLMKLSGLDLACHIVTSQPEVENRFYHSPEAVGVAAAGGDGPHLLLALGQLPPPALLLLLLVLANKKRVLRMLTNEKRAEALLLLLLVLARENKRDKGVVSANI